MSERKERALKKKKWLRGGIEPDPPRRIKKKRKKNFVLQHYTEKYLPWRQWVGGKKEPIGMEWRNLGKYVMLEDAIKAARDMKHRGLYKADSLRIINAKTKETIWDDERAE